MLILYLYTLPDADKKKERMCMCSLSDILTYITYMQRRKNLPTKVHKIELMNTKKKMRRKKKQNDKKQRRNRRVLLPVLLMTLTSLSLSPPHF
jgi:hypothetical protein